MLILLVMLQSQLGNITTKHPVVKEEARGKIVHRHPTLSKVPSKWIGAALAKKMGCKWSGWVSSTKSAASALP